MVKKKVRNASLEGVIEDPTTKTEEVDGKNNEASDKNANEVLKEKMVAEVESERDSESKKVKGEQPVVEAESGKDSETEKAEKEEHVAEVASNKESSEVRESGDEQPVVDSTVDEGLEDDQALVDATSETGGHQPGTEVSGGFDFYIETISVNKICGDIYILID
ncbi:hypothetical protein KIN20_024154 [Parelaphostrongylus tenuis]|uniref:Uncharacterized protein n=1 Tax=Parelaphostrongylus tenuis TaxID=148309 RepID=A0AAD5QW52_PARTN|nr:hypothetical protein KIN20_024154 [Parelaphostrongylus tenuis]